MTEEDSTKHKPAGRAVLNVVFASAGFVVLRLFLTPIRMKLLSGALSPEQYGTISLISVSISFIALVSSCGSMEFLFRFLPGRSKEYQYGILKTIFKVFGSLSIAIAVGMAIVLIIAGPGKLDMGVSGILASAVLLILSVHIIHRIYFLMATRGYAQCRLLQLVRADAWFVPLVIFAQFGTWNTDMALWTWAIWLALAIVLTWRWMPLESVFAVKAPPGTTKQMLSFGLPLMPMVLGEWLYRIVSHYVLLDAAGAETVAVYGIAVNLAMVGFFVGTGILDIFITEFNKARNALHITDTNLLHKDPGLRIRFTVMTRYIAAVSIPVIAVLCWLSEPLVRLLTHPEYLDAAAIAPWAAAMPLMFLINYVFSKVLLSMDKTKVVGVAWLASAILMISLNIIIVPHMGGRGAALANSISLALLSLFLAIRLRCWKWIILTELKLPRIVIYTILCAGGCYGLGNHTEFSPLVTVGLGAILCVTASLGFGLLSIADIKGVLSRGSVSKGKDDE
jgi:O-antigen/teichoic acid export membrane protein